MSIAKWILAGALLATLLAYWIGLHGPFVLDDANNLSPILEWLRGDISWQHVLQGNESGLVGRSLSMATLMFSAWLGGYEPFAFKLGNLSVHLLCGIAGWQVLRYALARDPCLGRQAEMIAALLAAVWLLHPLNVSTVLYSVQRMAQISTLFTLAALWAYLAARTALEQGHVRRTAWGLFGFFPLLLIAGLLGKENAAVTPALCLVFELAYFRQSGSANLQHVTTRILAAFYSAFLIVPAALVAGLFAFQPERLLGGYAIRDFSMWERLLSQGRAVIDYAGTLLLPRGSTMGLFQDDFMTSKGWLSPPSTAFALVALLAISVIAFALRKRAPSIFAGWLFFLLAHSIESSFLPLELYFEHRNYLPAFGLFLALAGTAEFLARQIKFTGLPHQKFGLLVAFAYVLALGLVTHARAYAWGDEGRLLTWEAAHHPGSLRANTALAFYAIQRGNMADAQAAIDGLLLSPDPRIRELGYLNRALAACIATGNANSTDLQEAIKLARPRVTLDELNVFANLAAVNNQRICADAGPLELADSIVSMLAAAHQQSALLKPQWSLRLTAARLYASAGDWQRALGQADLAWQSSADAPVGDFLVRAYVHNGMLPDAQRTFTEVAQRIDENNPRDQQGLLELKAYLDHALSNAGQATP